VKCGVVDGITVAKTLHDYSEAINMKPSAIHRVPWTCEWGRFGVAVEELGGGESRVDDVFWACHHPQRAPEIQLTKRDECANCPFWMEALRFRAEASRPI
jgi:hypothetical protein